VSRPGAGGEGPGRTAPPANRFVIAIDGPAGTGKSTVAQRVARALNAGYLDTGAMYRIITLAVLDARIDPTDDHAVADLLPQLTFDSPLTPGRQQHLFGGRDVSSEIRGQAVTVAVTPVSANPAVRSYLLGRQRELANSGRMVVEGRDIGTVVVPDAGLKIYLTADAQERARRRYHQNAGARARAGVSGVPAETAQHETDLAAVALDLDRRDTKDSTRANAPLQAAPDAVVIDSSQMAVEETVAQVLGLAAERGIR
jgi:cytidylate kinase